MWNPRHVNYFIAYFIEKYAIILNGGDWFRLVFQQSIRDVKSQLLKSPQEYGRIDRVGY